MERQEPKAKATVCFRRLHTGEVIGEIISEAGEVAARRSFGEMTENEFRRVLDVVKQEYPGVATDEPIVLTRN